MEMGPRGEREKISDPGGVRTQDLRNRSPLLYQYTVVYVIASLVLFQINLKKEQSELTLQYSIIFKNAIYDVA